MKDTQINCSGTSLWRRLGFSLSQNKEEFLDLLNSEKGKTSRKVSEHSCMQTHLKNDAKIEMEKG